MKQQIQMNFLQWEETYRTRSQENTDPDEFIFGPTSITKSVEATDEDEFIFCGPTMVTENA